MSNFKEFKQKVAALSAKLKITLVVSSCVILLIIIALFILHAKCYVETDNAYVNANMIKVAAQVSGRVERVNVANNQFVKAGTLLFELDSVPFKTALDKERAQLDIKEAELKNAQINTKRVLSLVQDKVLSAKDRDEAIKNLQVALASVQLSKAIVTQTTLDLTNSKVFAVTDGYITNMSLCVGNMVSASEPLFVLISNQKYWIDANFKETELKNIKIGQKVKIVVDMYPAYKFRGEVESISGGSGSAFSLLPPQNATGNWIKITQRVPIKIHVVNPDPKYPLKIGTTATVIIDTHK